MTEEECECEFGWTCPLCAPTGYRSRDKSKDDPLGIRFIAASPTTDAPTLAQFILDRVKEDEAVAREATPGPWTHDPRKEWFTDEDKLRAARAGIQQSGGEEHVSADGGSVGVAVTGPADDPVSMSDATHIARHDPARVLAQCAATRAIVYQSVGITEVARIEGKEDLGGDAILHYLASVYAAHPDFDPAWSV